MIRRVFNYENWKQNKNSEERIPDKDLYSAEVNKSVVLMGAIKSLREKSERKLPHKVQGLHFLYTAAHSMGDKQNSLELLVKKGKCELISVIEISWDNSHEGNAATEGYNWLKGTEAAENEE